MISVSPAVGFRPTVADELGEELRVVHDLVAAAEVRVLVGKRVEAVRAAGDDPGHTGVVERGDVLLGERLEDVLVAHAPGGVTRAGLARAEDGEVDTGGLQEPGGGHGRGPCALVEGCCTTNPVEHLRRRIARLEHADVEAVGPGSALDLRLAPWIPAALDVAQHRARLGGEARLDHHELPAQVDDMVDVLDLDRALVDAGSAGDAVPHHLLGDAAADERGQVAAGQRNRAFRQQLVADAHDQELG